jgi:hypothetical protein
MQASDQKTEDIQMRDLSPDDGNPQRSHGGAEGYEPPRIRALGTIGELTGSGSGANSDMTNTADQPGGSGGI